MFVLLVDTAIRQAIRGWGQLNLPGRPEHIVGALYGHSLAFALAAVFFGACVGIGTTCAGWFFARRQGRMSVTSVILPAGLSVWAIAALGLGLVRLWYAHVFWLMSLAGLMLLLHNRDGLWPAHPFRRPFRKSPTLVLALPILWGALFAFSPGIAIDSLMYHLAAPMQYSMVHGITPDWLDVHTKLPLMQEMLCSWAVCLREPRIAKIAALLFLVLALVNLRALARNTAQLGILAALWGLATSSQFLYVAENAKSDALALFLLSVSLAAIDRSWNGTSRLPDRRPMSWAWLSLGFAASAKASVIPAGLLLLFWGTLRHGRRWKDSVHSLRYLPIALVGLSPWWVKNWLHYGSPFYFFGCDILPSLGWTSENARAYLTHVERLVPAQTATLLGAMNYGSRVLFLDYPALFASTLLVLHPSAGRPARWTVASALVLGLLCLVVFRHELFTLPAAFLLAIGAAMAMGEVLPRLSGQFRGAFVGLIGTAGLAVIFARGGMLAKTDPLPFLFGSETERMWAERTSGPRAWALDAINRELHPRRLLLAGDQFAYGYECPVVLATAYGQAPVIWKLVSSAATPDDVSRGLRRMGISHIAYNFVRGQYQADIHDKYPWSPKMTAIYIRMLYGETTIVGKSPKIEHLNGGYVIYALGRSQAGMKSAYFLPGAEGITSAIEADLAGRRPKKASERATDLARRFPGVGRFRALLGHALVLREKWDMAYRALQSSLKDGIFDDYNLLSAHLGPVIFELTPRLV